MKQFVKKLLKVLGFYSTVISADGDKYYVPFKYHIKEVAFDEEKQEDIRKWYLKNMPLYVEKITNFKNNWIGREFGVRYKTGSSINGWNGVRLCIGKNWYVRLKYPEKK